MAVLGIRAAPSDLLRPVDLKLESRSLAPADSARSFAEQKTRRQSSWTGFEHAAALTCGFLTIEFKSFSALAEQN